MEVFWTFLSKVDPKVPCNSDGIFKYYEPLEKLERKKVLREVARVMDLNEYTRTRCAKTVEIMTVLNGLPSMIRLGSFPEKNMTFLKSQCKKVDFKVETLA